MNEQWLAIRTALGLARRPSKTPTGRMEHVVTRLNDGYYVCECGQAGSERWAILHEYPAAT